MHARTKTEYRGLLKEGYSNQELAGVSRVTDSDTGNKKNKPYEEWTKEELYQEAIKAGIQGRSYMSKKNLIHSLKKN